MQFVAGARQDRPTDRAIPTQEVLRIGMQTASGLAAARGLVTGREAGEHPAGGGVERVKLTDFGLAGRRRCQPDPERAIAGTLASVPEQAEGSRSITGRTVQPRQRVRDVPGAAVPPAPAWAC